jgi:hypothetical protein
MYSSNFPDGQKLRIMRKVIQQGKSIRAVVLAGFYFKQISGLTDLPPFSDAAYEVWWQKNQDKYK